MLAKLIAFLIPSRASFYFALASFIIGAIASGFIAHEFHTLQTTAAVNNARAKESGAVVISNKHETNLITQLRKDADENAKRANMLAALLKNQPICRVDPAIVRLLNQQMPATPGNAASAETTTAPTQTVTTNDVIQWANDNNAICESNRKQLAEVIAFYDDLRRCYNSRNWLDRSCSRIYTSP